MRELTRVLKEPTIGLRTLILFEKGLRELIIVLCKGANFLGQRILTYDNIR